MKKEYLYGIMAMCVIILFIVLANVEVNPVTGKLVFKGSMPLKYDDFAICLADSGAVMYGTEWCSHCKDQKAMFGDSLKYVNFVDCDDERQTCLDAGVRAYPTWVIGGEIYEGTQSLSKLADLSGCEIR